MHTIYHYHAPFKTPTKNAEWFREATWMSPDEIVQQKQLDAALIRFSTNGGMTTMIGGKLVRREMSKSMPLSLVLTQNYRYVLTENEMETFLNNVGVVLNLYLDLHQRLGVGYDALFLDKLVTRTYSALSMIPTEENIKGEVAHEKYPYLWLFPYVKMRLHETLSVGVDVD